jgi:hypothetical protein
VDHRERLVHVLEQQLSDLTSTPRTYDVSRALGTALRLLADLGYDFTRSRLGKDGR